MIASVHLADVGVKSALAIARRPPAPGSIAGLRHANVGIAAPLGGSVVPLGAVRSRRASSRSGMTTMRSTGSSASIRLQPFASGCRVRLAPLARTVRGPDCRATCRRNATSITTDPRPCSRSAGCGDPVDPIPPQSAKAEASSRRQIAGTHLGYRARASAHSSHVLGVGVDAGVVDVRLRSLRAGPSRRDRDRPRRSRSTTSPRSSASARTVSQGHLDGKNPLAEAWMANT